ncbi:MAG: SsrA-binding protein SmpB [Bacteroidales bacterium]
MKKSKGNSNVYIKNKRASYEYEFLDKYTAGIVLTGTEIKSIRAGKASLSDSYCYFINNELFVRNMHISDYWWASSFSSHEPKRDRKLLLNRRELRKLQRATKEKGLTITTISLFINEKGYAKLNIALAKGKKEYDKRNSIKEKDVKRDMDRSGY